MHQSLELKQNILYEIKTEDEHYIKDHDPNAPNRESM